MTLAQMRHSRVKPPPWGPVRAGLVAPEWRWFWHDARAAFIWSLPDFAQDLVGRLSSGVVGNGADVIVTARGSAWGAVDATSGLSFSSTATNRWVPQPPPLTVVALIKNGPGGNGDEIVIHKGRGGVSGWNFAIRQGDVIDRLNLSKQGVVDNESVDMVPLSEVSLVAASVDADKKVRYYVEGILKQTMANTDAFNDGTDAEADILVARDSGGGPASGLDNRQLLMLAVWARDLTDREHLQLALDPFGPFRMALPVLGKAPVAVGRIMGALAGPGGLAGAGGIAGRHGGIAG